MLRFQKENKQLPDLEEQSLIGHSSANKFERVEMTDNTKVSFASVEQLSMKFVMCAVYAANTSGLHSTYNKINAS